MALAIAIAIASQWLMTVMLFVWRVFAFGLSPALQAGMQATAERYTPRAVDFASGLNISAFNLDISFGSMLGALMALLPLAWLARRNLAAHVAGAAGH